VERALHCKGRRASIQGISLSAAANSTRKQWSFLSESAIACAAGFTCREMTFAP
jgi:hypothetical protein